MHVETENRPLASDELSQAPRPGSRGGRSLGSVCMLTSAHAALDVRIYEKEARSLADAGYDVTIVVPHDQDEDVEGVKIRAVPRPKNRPERMTRTLWRLYRKALAVRADIYHFHDPDLIPVGLLLKLAGKRVVYDVHEDVPRDILMKDWIASPLRRTVAAGAEAAHLVSALAFDGIVAATPTIAANFPRRRAVTIQNFPRLEDAVETRAAPEYAKRANIAVHTGLLAHYRGAEQMAQAISMLPNEMDARLIVAGRFDPPELQNRMEAILSDRFDYRGWLSRQEVNEVIGQARVGLVLAQPLEALFDSLPNKLFEYMGAGIPVVVSDFPLWRGIVVKLNCGLVADPTNPKAVAEALRWILGHPKEAEQMGQRGLAAAKTEYNWQSQQRALLSFYEHLSNGNNR